jgi:hypothetical protein
MPTGKWRHNPMAEVGNPLNTKVKINSAAVGRKPVMWKAGYIFVGTPV